MIENLGHTCREVSHHSILACCLSDTPVKVQLLSTMNSELGRLLKFIISTDPIGCPELFMKVQLDITVDALIMCDVEL